MRERSVAPAILLIMAGWMGAAAALPEPTARRQPVPAGTLGARSPEIGFPVENGLDLASLGGQTMIAGETDTSTQYQIQSRSVPLKSDTTILVLSLSGQILNGRMYAGLVDDHGRFLAPTRIVEAGPIGDLEIVVPSGTSRTAGLVLGNAQPGRKSVWRLWRIELSQYRGIPVPYLKKLCFEGSAWRWAFDVLRGAR